jgi:hypothetical protein
MIGRARSWSPALLYYTMRYPEWRGAHPKLSSYPGYPQKSQLLRVCMCECACIHACACACTCTLLLDWLTPQCSLPVPELIVCWSLRAEWPRAGPQPSSASQSGAFESLPEWCFKFALNVVMDLLPHNLSLCRHTDKCACVHRHTIHSIHIR